MFTGFRKEAVDFLIGIRLNNNETYYREHMDVYEREIKIPMRELNDAVTPVVHAMDPELDTRPNSVIARLRRDTRFTQDKSPFRDHIWMGWRYPGERRSEGFHMYWGFGPDWMGWGCGSYGTDRPLMDAFRQRILTEPDRIREIFLDPELRDRYTIYGDAYKKMTVPKEVPEDLKHLYVLKFLGADHQGTEQEWQQMQTPEFVECMIREIHAMTPLLQLMKALRNGDQPSIVENPEISLQEVAPAGTSEKGKIIVRTAEEFEF